MIQIFPNLLTRLLLHLTKNLNTETHCPSILWNYPLLHHNSSQNHPILQPAPSLTSSAQLTKTVMFAMARDILHLLFIIKMWHSRTKLLFLYLSRTIAHYDKIVVRCFTDIIRNWGNLGHAHFNVCTNKQICLFCCLFPHTVYVCSVCFCVLSCNLVIVCILSLNTQTDHKEKGSNVERTTL